MTQPLNPFLIGCGEQGKLIAAHDWGATPLGYIDQWSQSLKTSVSIILNSHQPMCIAWGAEQTFIYNDAYIPILSLSKHPWALARSFAEVWSEIWYIFGPLAEKVFKDGEPTFVNNVQLFIRRNDSLEKTYYSFSYSPIRDETGEVKGLLCSCVDVTAKLLLERRLKKLEKPSTKIKLDSAKAPKGIESGLYQENLFSIFMQAPIGICMFEGPEHVYVFANPTYMALFGGERELIGKSLRQALPELKGQKHTVSGCYYSELLSKVYRSGKPFIGKESSIFLLQADGSKKQFYLDFVCQPKFGINKKIEGILVVVIDVTAQVLVRKKIEEAEQRLKMALTSTHLGTWDWDIRSAKLTMDEKTRALHGFKDELQADSLKALIKKIYADDKKLFMSKFKNTVKIGKDFDHECRIVSPNGSIHWIHYMGKVLHNPKGKRLRIIGTVMDTTEKKKYEQDLKNAIAARDDFISIASHELKTPITSLKLQIQIAKRKLKPETHLAEKFNHLLDISSQQIDRLTNLIDDLLDIAKIRSGKFDAQFKPTCLKTLNENVVKRFLGELETKKNIIYSKIDSEIIGNWDESRIEQVLVNLVSNAIKYAPNKPIYINAKVKGGWVDYSIRDSGPGIAEEKQSIIFRRFERAANAQEIHGLGLGLYIVRKIVESHKGQIYVKSKEGKGSTFIVKLPIDPLLV